MSPELITAISAGIVVLFGAIGLLFQQILKQVGLLAVTLSNVHAKTEKIESLTNGAAEASSLELKALRSEVENLRARLDESHQAAADVRAAIERKSSVSERKSQRES